MEKEENLNIIDYFNEFDPNLINFIKEMGLYVNDLTYSTQKGKSGNIEYLALISRNNKCKNYNITEIIKESHSM